MFSRLAARTIVNLLMVRSLLACAAVLLIVQDAIALDTVVVAAGERPPYVGANLPNGGYAIELIREAYKRSGYELKVEFEPWARARLRTAQGDVDAQLTTDQTDFTGLAREVIPSSPFPGGTIGLLKAKSLKLKLHADALHSNNAMLAALSGYRFAAVRDGVSLAAFENKIPDTHKELVTGDVQSLGALEQNQVQFALIDKFAAADTMVKLRPHLIGQMEFVPLPQARWEFRLAFSTHKAQRERMRNAFNSALAEMQQDGTLERLLTTHGLNIARRVSPSKTRLNIGTVNNSDMLLMQRLSKDFEKQFPEIELDWHVLDENILRRRLLSDLALDDGQFDVITIGTYELPIWAERTWLVPFKSLPRVYEVDDLLPAVRTALTYKNELFALPFYAESVMTYYRRDLFAKEGLVMPANPTYNDIRQFAARLHHPENGVYGICLRGKPGWGENMALIDTMVHSYGGRWFDDKWQSELLSPEWMAASTMYMDLITHYGPPDAERNGFNENLTLFADGHCAQWIDASVAAGMLYDAKRSKVAESLGYVRAPSAGQARDGSWLWSWALAVPSSSRQSAAAQQFITWATSKAYVQSVASAAGWVAVPPGTRMSTYNNPNYRKAAPFADFVLDAINRSARAQTFGVGDSSGGVQYVSIPEFQALGDNIGNEMAMVLRKEQTLDRALKRAHNFTIDVMQRAGYSTSNFGSPAGNKP